MDLRQNKRYQLKALVTFFWESADGRQNQGHGYTRDISSYGVYVLTVAPLRKGIQIQLQVNLPSLNEKHNGLSLRTHGKVIRAEENGFAAVADMGFRIQLPDAQALKHTVGRPRKNGKHRESTTKGVFGKTELASRFSM